MLPTQSSREGQVQRNRIKIRNPNQFNYRDDNVLTQGQPYSFNDKNKNQRNNDTNNRDLSNSKRQQQKLSPLSTDRWGQKKKSEQGSIMTSDLAKKLQKISYSILQAQYGSSFTQNSSYFQWIGQLKYEDSMDKILHSYTSVLLTMIQVQEQNRFNSQPKFKLITLQKSERTKLKLILSERQQNQVNKFKSKGLQTYVKKIEEESEKHKRQHIRIKQRNRILQNQLLKLSLEFKNKRELYITQITRLTQILHSSFMQVGKMFVNISNHNSNIYPPGMHQKQQSKNIYNQPQVTKPTSYNRKNVKSASPIRRVQNMYSGDQQRFPDFMNGPVKQVSQYENYLKPQSVNVLKKNTEGFINEHRTNRHFDAQSQPGIEQRRRSDQKPPTFMSSTMNFNKAKDNS